MHTDHNVNADGPDTFLLSKLFWLSLLPKGKKMSTKIH
jgi:hypothetical protein